ncbi:hypothetical protein [Cognatishimia activa]|uniref:hypothetical protein n=1 Tax=Cognatishimia activa TaxID=1715691 RepID=UPI00222E9224|nr:hypothetical protein [Cognatishimia activa]UZD89650.1 hypothetical protein M0D42_08555 [Cognatishimia activa]
MAASIFDSPMFVTSFPTGEAARLFSDSAAVRAVLLVEGSLAKVQGELEIVPEDSAFFIHRSGMEVQIDPAGLAADMLTGGFAEAVAKAFAKAMEAPEHSKFILHDVNPDEIEAVALALRIRQFLSYCDKRIAEIENGQIDKAAMTAALSEARSSAIGLHMSAGLNVAKPLADALRLPLCEQPMQPEAVSAAAALICNRLSEAYPDCTSLGQLHLLSSGLNETITKDPAHMLSICLPQACLCAASALEIVSR